MYLISWEEVDEGQEACSCKKIKSNNKASKCLPGDLEDNEMFLKKIVKGPLKKLIKIMPTKVEQCGLCLVPHTVFNLGKHCDQSTTYVGFVFIS
jgi:hypothetical protein